MDNTNVIKFPVIETDRLILREIKANDRIELFKIFSSEAVMKYYGMFPYNSIEEADILISRFSKAFDENKSIRWGIELKSEKVLIGTCGFHNWNKTHRRVEIGYELYNKYWRKGYITEAISEILKFGFEAMEVNRIEALVYPENIPSQISLEKLNFSKEGILKEYCIFRDKKQDLIMYSLLNSNY